MVAGRIAPIVAAVAVAALAACPGDPAPTADCPPGSTTDETRSAHIASLLEVDAAVASRVAKVRPRSCFGSGAPGLGGVVADGTPATAGGTGHVPVLLLATGASDAELAARVAHLVRHAEEPPFLRGDEGGVVACSRGVVRAARVEAIAARDEVEVRRRLGLGPAPREEDVVAGYLARCRDR